MTQGRIWHALQPNWSMLTILVHCSFTPLLWPPCTRLIYVSSPGVFIRPQWSVVYPQRFYNFTMQVNLACPLGIQMKTSFFHRPLVIPHKLLKEFHIVRPWGSVAFVHNRMKKRTKHFSHTNESEQIRESLWQWHKILSSSKSTASSINTRMHIINPIQNASKSSIPLQWRLSEDHTISGTDCQCTCE